MNEQEIKITVTTLEKLVSSYQKIMEVQNGPGMDVDDKLGDNAVTQKTIIEALLKQQNICLQILDKEFSALLPKSKKK